MKLHQTMKIVCPFEAEWKFHKADLMHLKDYKTGYLNGKCFYSPNIPGLQHYIQIFPTGDALHCDGQTFVFLYVNGSNERKIEAEFSVSVESADFYGHFDCIYETSIGRGTSFGLLCSMPMNAFHNTKYYLTINPSIIREGENEAETWLYLFVEMEDETKIEAVIDFSIDTAICNHCYDYVYERSQGLVTLFWCSTNDLFDPSKRFIDDGYLTININGIFMKQKKQFITLNYKRSS
uniref:Uncharacterized protein n=1 Tax=Panagrolaimus sp. PS1159 TaxID=55785 RepID=A0AC35F2T5_9BILA